jgi:hypothetical protein
MDRIILSFGSTPREEPVMMGQLVLFAPVICGVLNLAAAGIGLTAAVLTHRAARVN